MPSSPHREVTDEQDVDVALQPQISAVVAVIAERHELGLDGLLGEVLPALRAWTQRSEIAPSPSARRNDRRFEYGSMRRSLRWIMRTRSRGRRRPGSPDACGNRKASVCQRTTGGRSRSGIAATALSGWRYQVAVPRSHSNRSGDGSNLVPPTNRVSQPRPRRTSMICTSVSIGRVRRSTTTSIGRSRAHARASVPRNRAAPSRSSRNDIFPVYLPSTPSLDNVGRNPDYLDVVANVARDDSSAPTTDADPTLT